MNLYRDTFERAVSTYVETFCGLLIAAGLNAPGVHLLSILETAAIAALPTGLAVIKAAVGSQIGGGGASIDPGAQPADIAVPARTVALATAISQSLNATLESMAKLETAVAAPSGPLADVTTGGPPAGLLPTDTFLAGPVTHSPTLGEPS